MSSKRTRKDGESQEISGIESSGLFLSPPTFDPK